jgi:hypothetical protein
LDFLTWCYYSLLPFLSRRQIEVLQVKFPKNTRSLIDMSLLQVCRRKKYLIYILLAPWKLKWVYCQLWHKQNVEHTRSLCIIY